MLPKTFKIFDFPIIRRLSVPDEGFSGKLDIYVFIDWLWFGLVPLSTTAGYNPYDRGIHWVCEANINWSLRQDINEYL
jgi:hypothetical protein